MSTSGRVDRVCVAVTVLALILTVLFMNGEALGLEVIDDGDGGSGYFTENDLDGDWDGAEAHVISLTGDGAQTSGGAYFADGAVHIVSAGRYRVTGELSDGQIVVEAGNGDKIWLMLDGADITCSDGAAIEVREAEKVFLTLKAGSVNRVCSGTFTDAASGVDGAIYSKDDLTVNGSGELTVESAGHGIVGNDDLVITGGTVDITASEDGIHANDSVRIRDAKITVNAGDDGVTVSNDEMTGFFYMESGSLSIPSCYEGVEGQEITVAGGEIEVYPTDDGFNAKETGSAINITGGSVRIVNENGRDADGLDSNGSIYISGGSVLISMSASGGSAALDAGTESGGVCRVSGGTVIAAGAATMAECFDSDSEQGFISAAVSGGAGAKVELRDDTGTVLAAGSVPCAFSSLIISAPGMSVGDSVTLSVDGEESVISVDNSGANGFGGGFGGFGGRGGAMGQMGQMGRRPESGTASGDTTPPDGESGRDMVLPEAPDGDNGGESFGIGGGFAFGNGLGPGGGMGQDGTAQDGTAQDGTAQTPWNRGGGERFDDRTGMTGSTAAVETQTSIDAGSAVLVLVSVLALAAGIVVAVKVKH